jgi:glycerol uptake facilitator-like aquaporin
MEETKEQPLALRVCAELAGSFLLCFAIYAFSTWGSAVYGVNVVFSALATALAYAVVTAIFSHISGGQLNPAVTVAAVLSSKTKIVDGIAYVVAQVIGAIAAGFAVVKLLPTSEQVSAKIWLTPAVNGFEQGSVSYSLLTQYGITFSIALAIVVEVVGALLVVSAAMATLGKHGESSDRHVVVMGLAYGLAAAISYPVTGAGLNPARSTGIALASMNQGLTQNPVQQLWVFWICPILAAAVVALVMIVVQMVTTPKVKVQDEAADDQFDQPVQPEDAETEQSAETSGTEAHDQSVTPSQDSDESAEEGVSEDAMSKETVVNDQQPDSKGDADEGIKRD